MSTSPRAATLPAPQQLWILGPWQDVLLFIGTPLLILPMVLLAQMRFRVEEISLFVASFGALGHHLPGMIRAYGDRDLFQRFRMRFIVAPIFLLAVCVVSTVEQLGGITLVLYLWGVWHGLAQTYGFLRIYDSKVKSVDPLTSRLDMAMCVAWFGGGVLLSEPRMYSLLSTFYDSGGPLVPALWLHTLRGLAGWGVVAVTLVFTVHMALRWRAGQAPNPLKLLLMLTTFSFWWYSNVVISNLLVGIALFEIFHDVQYLSIVWLFNLNRAEKGAHLGGFSRFLFRRSSALIGAYVGLVFAYGTLNYVTQGVPFEPLQRVLMGVLIASALLHFYYDGFIWKVREKSTRQSLGLEGGKEEGAAAAGPPVWLTHGAKWLLFVAPLVWLGASQVQGLPPELARTQALAAALPGLAEAHHKLGLQQLAAGDGSAAAASFRAALARDAAAAESHLGLGHALLSLDRLEEAGAAYQRAVELQADLAGAHNGLGNVLLRQGDGVAAIAAYRRAVELDPELASAHGNLGNALAAQGQVQEALDHQRRAVALRPDAASMQRDLARTLAAAGAAPEAVAAYQEALRRAPEDGEAHFELANLLAAQGQGEAAVEHYRAALRLQPAHPEGCYNLANTLVGLGRIEEALASYQQALAARPAFPQARHNLGAVLLGLGQPEMAEAHLREALRLAPGYADAHLTLAAALRRLGRHAEAAEHEAAARQAATAG